MGAMLPRATERRQAAATALGRLTRAQSEGGSFCSLPPGGNPPPSYSNQQAGPDQEQARGRRDTRRARRRRGSPAEPTATDVHVARQGRCLTTRVTIQRGETTDQA